MNGDVPWSEVEALLERERDLSAGDPRTVAGQGGDKRELMLLHLGRHDLHRSRQEAEHDLRSASRVTQKRHRRAHCHQGGGQ